MLKYAGKKLTTAATARLCTTAELGRVLSMTFAENDTFALSLIDSATAMLEAHCNHYFCAQTFNVYFTGDGYKARLPIYPVASVSAVVVDGTAITSDDYTIDLVSARMRSICCHAQLKPFK